MRLFDGQRSAVFTFHEQALATAAGGTVRLDADRVARWWLRLERQLCGGYADVDQPDAQQIRQQARRLRHGAVFCEDLT